MSDDLDLEGDASEVIAPAVMLAAINPLVLDQLALKGEVDELERALKEKKHALKLVEEVRLPEALAAAQTMNFTTLDGINVAVKDELTMSIPKKEKPACMMWLTANKLGDLIKPTVTITLPKGDNRMAFLEDLLKENKFEFSKEDDANTTSIKAALKKRLEDGQEVPLKMFGGHLLRKAVITLPK